LVAAPRRLESGAAPATRCASGLRERKIVGGMEVFRFRRRSVANHPQSLWITLWTGSKRDLQVAHRKGLSFGRSKFERRVFH
jgi:hypothetical protein